MFSNFFFFFLMIRRPPRSTPLYSSAASDVYKRQAHAARDERRGPRTVVDRRAKARADAPFGPPQRQVGPRRSPRLLGRVGPFRRGRRRADAVPWRVRAAHDRQPPQAPLLGNRDAET